MYECLDSIEALEILLVLYRDPARAWTPADLSDTLRLNSNSVSSRLRRLRACGLLKLKHEGYVFQPVNARDVERVGELDRYYQSHRHRILEAIISPMKKAHDFAQAFRVRGSRPKGEDSNGC